MQRILIMGLPGAGKTTLAASLKKQLEDCGCTVTWLNADEIRTQHDDWDFSEAGRIRQSKRMYDLANLSTADYVIADFVAPLEQMRLNFSPDWLIWVDTIPAGRFADTNAVFTKPEEWDFHITEQDAERHAVMICRSLREPFA